MLAATVLKWPARSSATTVSAFPCCNIPVFSLELKIFKRAVLCKLNCKFSLISDGLLPFWSHEGYIFLPDSFFFNGCMSIHHTLKQPLPIIISIIHITKNLSYMPRGISKSRLSCSKSVLFVCRKVLVRVFLFVDFLHHFYKLHMVVTHFWLISPTFLKQIRIVC